MKFSIVTPSFNQLSYLKRCVASVADQQGVDVEHIVIDGGSTDGTVEFIRSCMAQQPSTNNYQLTFVSEADEGMYDALNKGFDRSSGDLFAWLNCDEQYLPGTLTAISDFFDSHSEIGLLCGDALVVDPDGKLSSFWKSMPLRRTYLETGYLYNLSCAIFFRACIFREGLRFDSSFRAAGDQELIIRLLRKGIRTAQARRYLAAYTFMPGNLSEQGFAVAERLRRSASAGGLRKAVLRTLQRAERLLRGCRMQKFPLEYALYTGDKQPRVQFKSGRVSSRWPGER
jgi:glycosyltransferase involved in cell wall biosynthesis